MSRGRAITQPYGRLDTLPPASSSESGVAPRPAPPSSSGVAPRPALHALLIVLRSEWLELHNAYRAAELEYSRLALRVAPLRSAARARARELEIKLDALSAEVDAAEAALNGGTR